MVLDHDENWQTFHFLTEIRSNNEHVIWKSIETFNTMLFRFTLLLSHKSILKIERSITFPSRTKEESNPLLKCQSVIDVNIFARLLSLNSSIDMIFIWRENLHVMSFLPPPGGPIAVMRS